MSFKIQSELSENQIEADIASYLGYITPLFSKRFGLVSIEEGEKGADKLFNRFMPIFLQFKVSHGLDPKASILKRFLNGQLAKIVSYRKANELGGDPILYFGLRRMAKTATEFQHNLLRKMHQPPEQYGLYVAPLTLKLDEYQKLLDQEPRRWWPWPYDPFRRRDLEIVDSMLAKKYFFKSNPFLRHHISIPPHIETDTHHHHYSFSKNGADVAWHGGELVNGDYRFASKLAEIYQIFYEDRQSGTRMREFIEKIGELKLEGLRDYDGRDYDEVAQMRFIGELVSYLKDVHQISLFFLIDESRYDERSHF